MVTEPIQTPVLSSRLPPFVRARLSHFGVIVFAAVLMQLALHYTYLPWWCGDSGGYTCTASFFYGSGFTGYIGQRTPGYPVFLIVCDLLARGRVGWMLSPHGAQIVTWAQSALCVASAILLYLSIERLQIRASINLGVTLFFALLIGVNEFAMLILSETLSAFFLILAVYFATVAADLLRRGQAPATFALLSGLAYASAILTRPNLLFTWVLFIGTISFFMGCRMVQRHPLFSARALEGISRPCFSGAALLLIAWLFFNYEHTGYLTLSMITDDTRSCTAYNLFDRVEPKDKVLGEIMDRYYRQTNQNGVRNPAYIWLAYAEIHNRSREMPVQVSPGNEALRGFATDRYLCSVSNGLLMKHPGVWAQNSLADLAKTLDFSFPEADPRVMDDPVGVALPPQPVIVSVRGWQILSALMPWQAGVVLCQYLLTFLAGAVALRAVKAARNLGEVVTPLILAAFALGAIACMIAPSILANYVSRYSVPLIPLFSICSAYLLEEVFRLQATGEARKRREGYPFRAFGCLSRSSS